MQATVRTRRRSDKGSEVGLEWLHELLPHGVPSLAPGRGGERQLEGGRGGAKETKYITIFTFRQNRIVVSVVQK